MNIYSLSKKITIILVIILFTFAVTACTEPVGSDNPKVDPDQDIFGENIEENISDNNEETLPPAPLTVTYIRAKAYINVRSGNGLSYNVVGKLDRNDLVLYCNTVGNWHETKYKGKTAYVSSSSMYTELIEIEQENATVENVLDVGYSQLGYPYVWGSERYHWGNGILNKNFVEGKFDCSALMLYIFYFGADINLYLTSREQSRQGTEVLKENIKRGDLLFFTNSSRYYKTGIERIGHVGVYLGDNYILHTASDHAVIEPISSTRWSYYISAKRLV